MKIIYGQKGTGKTKTIISEANGAIERAKGNIVYVTDNSRYSVEIKRPIRFVDTSDFGISDKCGLIGFLKGIVAANFDNELVFLDGIARISKEDLKNLEEVFDGIEMLEKKFGVLFTLTVSSSKEDLPDFVLKRV